jgi:hypothetical protein
MRRCYTIPIVTGKKYFFHFGAFDWRLLEVSTGNTSAPGDDPIYMVNRFAAKRLAIDVNINGTQKLENNTIPLSPVDYRGGQNLIINRTLGRMEAHFILDHRGVNMEGFECVENCEAIAPSIN